MREANAVQGRTKQDGARTSADTRARSFPRHSIRVRARGVPSTRPAAYPLRVSRPAQSLLQRAFTRFAEVVSTKDAARRWYEGYLARLGTRAVVDTSNNGTLTWVHRRAADSEEVLPLPTVRWTKAQVADRLLEGIQIHDGRQRVTLLYDDDGRIADRSLDDRFPGRLVELARLLADGDDGLERSIAFVAELGDEHHGPGRVHYPVLAPGGVAGAWRTGLKACRRALFDGRVGDEARYLVADGVAGTAIGVGATREEAVAAYATEVERAFPERRREIHTATDDYDDDGNLIKRGEVPPELREPAPPSEADTVFWQPEPEEREAWRGEPDESSSPSPPAPEVDPITGRVDFGTFVMRGPKSDAPPLPRRPECLPHVVLPLEASPTDRPPRGRWVRTLGELGVTRHVVRIEERDGFMLVGADLFGFVDLSSLRAELDRLDALDPPLTGRPEHERYVRFRARQYRWSPATDTRPEGLAVVGGSSGPRFEAGGLDGDALQAMVHRHMRVQRPTD